MREKNIKVKLSKRFSLYGKLQGAPRRPLLVVVHGFPGSMDEDFYSSAVQWFYDHGFSTFRFNLYGPQRDARQSMDCTLKINSADLAIVIKYLREKGFKKIFAAGHSFGALAIFLADTSQFNAVTLWDPSYKISFTKKMNGFSAGKYLKEIKAYLMKWGMNVIVGREMAKEVDLLQWSTLAKNFRSPTQIIIAGKGALRGAKRYLKQLRPPKELLVIKGATHYFNDKIGLQSQVFRASADWFRKFI